MLYMLLIPFLLLLTTSCVVKADDFCDRKSDGQYPYPYDCSKFYQCVNGKTYISNCAAGLHYRKDTQNCDWPSHAQCSKVTTVLPPTTRTPTTEQQVSSKTMSLVSNCHRTLFFPSNLESGKALLNHTISNLTVTKKADCRSQCFMNNDCVSYNVGEASPAVGMVCQLNDADRFQHPKDFKNVSGFSYHGTKSSCRPNTCHENAKCQHGYGEKGYRCICPLNMEEDECSEDSKEIKANDEHVCVGAKDDQFGEFQLPETGIVKTFKLIYRSGGVSQKNEETKSNWGSKSRDTFLCIFVTDVNGSRIAPPSDYNEWNTHKASYQIDNVEVDSPQLKLPELSIPRSTIKAGTKFRIWLGEDLMNKFEFDNVGSTCMDVIVVYAI